jgi:hypothetical protein
MNNFRTISERYKMNETTKGLAHAHFFIQNDPWLAICTVARVLPFCWCYAIPDAYGNPSHDGNPNITGI